MAAPRIPFKKAEFIQVATQLKFYPQLRDDHGTSLPEIAIAGRSNVGKSTLINHLLRYRGLAKTSSTPGKTQTIAFFKIDEAIGLIDLPGYGYAKVPEKVRREWGPMVQEYLDNREQLQAVLFLLDIRRTPNKDDIMLIEYFRQRQLPTVVIFTKVDKVKLGERKQNKKKALEILNAKGFPSIYYSSTKNEGRENLIQTINQALAPEPVEAAEAEVK